MNKSSDIRQFFNPKPKVPHRTEEPVTVQEKPAGKRKLQRGPRSKEASPAEKETAAEREAPPVAATATSRFLSSTKRDRGEIESQQPAPSQVKKPKSIAEALVKTEPEKAAVAASAAGKVEPKQSFSAQPLNTQKFSRSAKSLVKPKKTKEPVAAPTKKHEFDFGDDFDFDDSMLDPSTYNETSATIADKLSQSQRHSMELSVDDDIQVLHHASPTKREMKSASPIDLTRQSSPAPVKAKKPSPSTPKTQSSSAPLPEESKKHSPEKHVSPEKKKAAFRSFISRAGPVAPGSKPLPVGKDNCLMGMSFVFTGELDSTPRDQAVDLVKRYGGRVVSAPSSKTDYVVIGREPGDSKLTKVAQLKLKTLDEDSFFALIESLPAKLSASAAAAAQPLKAATKSKSVSEPVLERKPLKPSPTDTGKMPATFASNKAIPPPPQISPVKQHINELWTVKYAPKTSLDIIGNKTLAQSLVNWLKDWKTSISPEKAKDAFRAALISGPPGIGKTTAAHIIAKECGYEAIEMNASDVRNKNSVDQIIRELTGNHSIAEYFQKSSAAPLTKNHLLIMDECDGMGGGDRGGIAELIKLIKKSKIPIICICNDRQSPKVRSLANHCLDIRFHRPTAAMIRGRVEQIARKENFTIEPNAIEQLVSCAHSDIRQVLNMLQTWNLRNRSMTYDQSKKMSEMTQKNVDMGPFDLVGKLMNGSTFRAMSMEDKNQIYFTDYQLVPPFVQENYARMKPWQTQGLNSREQDCSNLAKLAAAAESISDGDLTEAMIYGKQEFSLMPVHAMFSTIKPVYHMMGNMGERLAFPSILGQISKTNKGLRILKELHLHMRLHISGDKNQIWQSYLPALIPRLCQPLAVRGVEAIEDVIGMMDRYFLTKDDWDNMLELGLGPLAGINVLKHIPASVKSAFTRTYNKSSHPSALAGDTLKKPIGAGGMKISVDMEEALDVDDAGEDEVDDGADQDDDVSTMQVKKKPAAASKKQTLKASKSTASSSSRGGSSSNVGAKKKTAIKSGK